MKSLISTLLLLLTAIFAIAQTPQMINYQGVALSAGGLPIANSTISIRSSIHNSTPNGTVLYSETRSVSTDATGLFSFQIGGPGSSSITGVFSNINWEFDPKHLQVEMDITGGSNFTDMGTQQLVTVPYALHAKEAAGISANGVVYLPQLFANNASTGQVIKFNGTDWAVGNDEDNGLTLPYASVNSNATSFVIENFMNNNGNSIHGKANGTSSTGIKGTADQATGTGVFGTSSNGFGVRGYGGNATSVGVQGQTLNGTGVKAISVSSSGTALDVSGNVKIAGGNTNPSDGAVLTSDATGNAVWKPKKVAFDALYTGALTYIANATATTMFLNAENFDVGNDFNLQSAANDPSTFIAPVSGVYHFSAQVRIFLTSNVYNLESAKMQLRVNNIERYSYYTATSSSSTATSAIELFLNNTTHLNAGDKVKIVLYQNNGGSITAEQNSPSFSGHLVFAD